MPKDNPASNVKNTHLYAALRQAGVKKKKAKRVASAVAAPGRPAKTSRATTKTMAKSSGPKKAASTKKATRPTKTARPTKAARPKKARSSTAYEKWTKAELLQRAKTVGVKGRSRMTKKQLTQALRTA
jgi:hypothetical protein